MDVTPGNGEHRNERSTAASAACVTRREFVTITARVNEHIFKSTNRGTSATNAMPYRRRRSLLSAGELRFFISLQEAVGEWWGISIKTRLADIIRCPEKLWHSSHGRKLSQKHVDFVLYDRNTAATVAAIELDDRSHDKAHRRERDAFVNAALNSAGVLLLRVQVSAEYRPTAIRRYIERATKR